MVDTNSTHAETEDGRFNRNLKLCKEVTFRSKDLSLIAVGYVFRCVV